MTPEPAEKTGRGKGKSQGKDKDGGTIGKIRHLKKEDGEPLWRKDIQHDFLKAVFDDMTPAFTNSYEPGRDKQNFADLYIDTMSRSSKTSKVLRDKLLSDRDAAKGMAMVCLLVNIGRMNTTLNFFPEMRAQLRTYHAIPSLQAHQDPHAYKQLQDAPRLKSILKGGAEDRQEPGSLNKIKARDCPRTNPVNLLFVICNAALKVAELHFPPGQEFHDLVMKTNYTSKSRAKAFLWIMWFYLESDFTEEGCDENPFGRGVDYGVDVANQGVPRLEEMTPEEEARENIDTPKEMEFGHERQKTRAKILEADQQFLDNQSKRGGRGGNRVPVEDGPAILPRIRPSRNESDMDSIRSTPPPKLLGHLGAKSSGRRGGASLKYQAFEASSPGGPGAEGIIARKPRPPTAHQLAVERNRSQRVEHILDQGLRKEHRRAPYRRANRRLARWAQYKGTGRGVIAPVKKRSLVNGAAEPEENGDIGEVGDETLLAGDEGHGDERVNGHTNGDVTMADDGDEVDDIEDADRTVVGANSGGEEEELDDMERSLLGMAPGDEDDSSDSD
ncbi:putative transcriptional regulatory protein C15D4.02 [Verticillium dahliae VDG1]|nr:putative transcriptional regulatory protein C15D4.02 [Verticillium dahliae VDG1]